MNACAGSRGVVTRIRFLNTRWRCVARHPTPGERIPVTIEQDSRTGLRVLEKGKVSCSYGGFNPRFFIQYPIHNTD